MSLTPPSPPLEVVGLEDEGGEVVTEASSLPAEGGGRAMETEDEGLPPPQEWEVEGGGREEKVPLEEEKEEKQGGEV